MSDIDEVYRLVKKKFGTRVTRSRKRGEELRFKCPRCKRTKIDLNIHTGMYHCFVCGLDGKVKIQAKDRKYVREKRYDYQGDDTPLKPVPRDLDRVFLERGIEPKVAIARYRIEYDGARLCFPVDKGYWRRSIFDGQEPKVLCDQETSGGILGEHLFGNGQHIVLTEGDYKALSIPLPWIGGAIGGVSISKTQLDKVVYHEPALVYVALDGGKEREADRIVKKLASKLVHAVKVTLPEDKGPDDIPVHERVNLLLNASKEGTL